MKTTSRILFGALFATPLMVQLLFIGNADLYAGRSRIVPSVKPAGSGGHQLSSQFTYKTLATTAEAPLPLRFFSTAVKTDSRGRIITGSTSDSVKNIVGPELAGERGGLQRFTKIMFGAGYIDGRPDPGTRIDPNNPHVSSGNE